MNKVTIFRYLLKSFGLRWLLSRLGYAIRIRTGWIRRQLPSTRWDDHPLRQFLTDASLAHPPAYLAWRKSNAVKFFFEPSDRNTYQVFFGRWDKADSIMGYTGPFQEADRLAEGVFRYFAHTNMPIGFPPDWHKNPFTGQSLPADLHWGQIGDFGHGDIKVIWDLNRFRFVYTLVRAYWRSGNEEYPQVFWQLIEHWRAHNPPQQGANWKCGQETSFRVMAWCFGLYGFLDSPVTTAERVAMLAQMIAISGERIEKNIQHALSQQNNHGVSEAMGLWTIGLLFSELRDASRWQRKSHEILETLGRDLFYEDGTFSQHSASYQRLALHDYLWAIQLGAQNGRPFSPSLIDRLKQSAALLYQLQDEESGRVPCFGHNDGSLILPLDNTDYQDYRAVVQAIHYLATGERCYHDGAWDEGLLWLFGPQAIHAAVHPALRKDFQAKQGGYTTIRSESSFAMISCSAYSHRPAHADQLNLDLWWRGQNITLDAGTYSYNAPPPWDHPFSRSSFHNAVTVDDRDQMERVGRFLWLPWADGKVIRCQRSANGVFMYWEGTHNGYSRLPDPVRVRRGLLRIGSEHWLALDWLHGSQEHSYRLQWLLPDVPYAWDEQSHRLTLETAIGPFCISTTTFVPADFSVMRADPASPRGWVSPYYYDRQPALSLDCSLRGKSVLICTLFGPEPARLALNQSCLRVEAADGHADLELSSGAGDGKLMAACWESLPGALWASDQLDFRGSLPLA